MAEGRYEEALAILKQGAKANNRTLPPDSELREMVEKFKSQVDIVVSMKLMHVNQNNLGRYESFLNAVFTNAVFPTMSSQIPKNI